MAAMCYFLFWWIQLPWVTSISGIGLHLSFLCLYYLTQHSVKTSFDVACAKDSFFIKANIPLYVSAYLFIHQWTHGLCLPFSCNRCCCYKYSAPMSDPCLHFFWTYIRIRFLNRVAILDSIDLKNVHTVSFSLLLEIELCQVLTVLVSSETHSCDWEEFQQNPNTGVRVSWVFFVRTERLWFGAHP